MRALLFLALAIFSFGTLSAQSVGQLRTLEKQAREKAEKANALLEEKTLEESQTINSLRLLTTEIELREELVENIKNELAFADEILANNELVLSMLEEDMVVMKEEYAKMIRFAQESLVHSNALIYLLSSENGSQAYQRWLYINQYARHRNQQLGAMQVVSESIAHSLATMDTHLAEKDKLLHEKQKEVETLTAKKKEKDRVLLHLDMQKTALMEEIERQNKLQLEIESKIPAVFVGDDDSQASLDILTKAFEGGKGKLPWPVSGVISQKFGVHKHSTIPTISVRNNGVNISCKPGSHIKAVYSGRVSKVFTLGGADSYVVIVRHGSYLTVYSNLERVSVEAGQRVTAGNFLGVLGSDSSILKFQVWHENTKLDPEEWLKK